jgi:hypothetical protein
MGCAGLDQKIADSKVTQKMKDWKVALQKKFSSDDEESQPQDNESAKGDENSSSGIFVYAVQHRGETLITIAKWYTGNAANNKVLANANPKLAPNRIPIGSQVNIPTDLLKTRDPMSPEFADKHLPKYYEHRIRWSGETLSMISKWYTGRYNNWKILVNHNPEINPKRIRLGQKIYIPNNILKTRKPLPQKFAAKGLPSYFAYTVQRPGERLTEIAGWYTGDAKNWQYIAKANPDLDPEFLLVGNEIYIPAKLLKTRDPFPQTSGDISEQKSKKESPTPTPAATQKKEKEIQLFGPLKKKDRIP